jgi:hypothetical protein
MRHDRAGMLAWSLALLATFLLCSCGRARSAYDGSAKSDSLFTPEHSSVADAVKEFLGRRATPIQPIAFPHNKHVAKGIACTVCHVGVNKGPVAGIPSDKLCMHCHEFLVTDRPGVQKLASYFDAGLDVPWQRVYGFSASAHVKFNHAPHIRAGVDCSRCHGEVSSMTVAVRAVQINMGFCVSCHRARQASTDCITCHF